MCDLSESVIYQEIFQKGEQLGRQKAARKIAFLLLETMFGALSRNAYQ
jgi:predicted transposase YdaD